MEILYWYRELEKKKFQKIEELGPLNGFQQINIYRNAIYGIGDISFQWRNTWYI